MGGYQNEYNGGGMIRTLCDCCGVVDVAEFENPRRDWGYNYHVCSDCNRDLNRADAIDRAAEELSKQPQAA